MRNNDSFILEDKTRIRNFLAEISDEMYAYIDEKPKSDFVLFYKYLTHSDLPTFGKSTRPNTLEKNLLYYMSVEQMRKAEEQSERPFQTAKQSCIGLSKEFYDLIGLKQPRDNDIYLINDYVDVYLVNSNLDYFRSKYTKKVFTLLDKTYDGSKWDFNSIDVSLSNDRFTPIELHCAVHGLGMSIDTDFHKLRHHTFKGDTFILLGEITPGKFEKNNLFILLEKNPAFFSVIGESNREYEDYQRRTRERLINIALQRQNALADDMIEQEISRRQQTAWRRMLAQEMMSYSRSEGEIFCPFTYISGQYSQIGALFKASHIKGFADPDTRNEEKYDLNNGFLLSANADALFDQHLIAIDENKEFVFSFKLDDVVLQAQLLLNRDPFGPILNEKRMEYLRYHKQKFDEAEAERRFDATTWDF